MIPNKKIGGIGVGTTVVSDEIELDRLGDNGQYICPEFHSTEEITLKARLESDAFSAKSKHSREAACRGFHAPCDRKWVPVAAITIHNRPSCTY